VKAFFQDDLGMFTNDNLYEINEALLFKLVFRTFNRAKMLEQGDFEIDGMTNA